MPKNNFSTVNRFDAFSVARIYAILGTILGVIGLFIVAIISAFGGLGGFGVGIVIGIVLIVAGAVVGFVGGFLEATIYNIVAGAVGGVKIAIDKSGLINKVDPLSFTKIMFVINAIVFIIIGIFMLGALMKGFGFNTTGVSGLLVGIFFIAILILDGLVIPYIEALLYNAFADRIGGIKVTITKGVLARVEPMTYAKIVACVALVIVLVQQLITSVIEIATGHGTTATVLSVILSAIIGVIAAFVVGGIAAAIYNYLAGRFGGVKLEIGK